MLSIVIPVFNEEELLEPSLRILHEYTSGRGIDHEIIVVSNGSTDRTVEVGNALALENSAWLSFFHLEEKGVGLAFAKGVSHAKGEFIVSIDIDLPADLRFIDYSNELLKHCDMVVGSKSMGNQRRALVRILGSQLYIVFAQLLFRLTISDYAPSTKAYRRESIIDLLPNLDHWTGYVFELCVNFRANNKKVLQIGVDCVDLRRSRFNLFHEGIYRYSHLFRCLVQSRNKSSWLYHHK